MSDIGTSARTVYPMGSLLPTHELAKQKRYLRSQARGWDIVGTLVLASSALVQSRQVRGIVLVAGLACYVQSHRYGRKHQKVADLVDGLLLRSEGAYKTQAVGKLTLGLEGTLYQEVLDYTRDPLIAYLVLARVARQDAQWRALTNAALGAAVTMAPGRSKAAAAALGVRGVYWASRSLSMRRAARMARQALLASEAGSTARLRAHISGHRGGLTGLEMLPSRGQSRHARLIITAALEAKARQIASAAGGRLGSAQLGET